MTEFTPLASLMGGALIGCAAVLLMLANGRIAGVSGIAGSLLPPVDRQRFLPSAAFVVGLLAAPVAYGLVTGSAVSQKVSSNMPLMALAGVLVGLGSAIGSGCTSGHGVCGLSRLSPRSLVATATFMACAFVTVFVSRHVIAG